MATKLYCHNECKLILRALFARLPDGSTKMYQRPLIPLAFGALVLENELKYHGLAGRINSAYDACILCENFVKFSLVTPELTWLICERQV